MKNHTTALVIAIFFACASNAQQSIGNTKWIARKVFQNDVFIENKGQFDNEVTTQTKQSVLYYSRKGSEQIFFSANAFTYKYDSIVKDNSKPFDRDDDKTQVRTIPQYMSVTWVGANTNTDVEVQEPVSNYFIYPNPDVQSKSKSILAHAWKRLIYHNLYKGMDVIFYYPDRGGIEYDVIVHPGADIRQFKMKYNGGQAKLVNGNMIVASPLGRFIDHAPIAKDEKGNRVISSFIIKGSIVSFKTSEYDRSEELIIDPWTTSPNFSNSSVDNTYDINYDNNGNVYAYGGGGTNLKTKPYELVKFNNAGVIQWTFTNGGGISDQLYGDFALDRTTGTSYVVGPPGTASGAVIEKINSEGKLVADTVVKVIEIWRAFYNACEHNLLLGLGSTSQQEQIATLDTNLRNYSPVNILNDTNYYHDVCLMAIDPFGSSGYAAFAKNTANPYFNNVIAEFPLTTLGPANYITPPDGYNFTEIGSVKYTGSPGTNAMNGMVAGPVWLYLYDGATLKKFNKNTGAQVDSTIVIVGKPFKCGGLDLDACGNVYVGRDSSIQVYDSNLTLQSTINLADTVYDLKVTNNGQLFACGKGFVSEISIPVSGCADSSCSPSILTGINNIESVNSVTIYPNPSNGKFTINTIGISNQWSVEVYDMLGQNVYSHSAIQTPQFIIDLNDHAKGVYLYRVITEKGTLVSSGKVVIQ